MFWKLEKSKVALEVLDKFSEFGCTSDGDSYYLAIQAAGKKSMVGAAWGVCEKMISSGCFADGKKAGEIVTFFCKGKKVTEAHSVYLAVKEKKVQIPTWLSHPWISLLVLWRRMMRPSVWLWSYWRNTKESLLSMQASPWLPLYIVCAG
uniref:Pentatricopeptide repeat-containing protein n=1 Tax=Triticum urartu TaxID=4572 RepID=A0A8R7UHP0_TRIUA